MGIRSLFGSLREKIIGKNLKIVFPEGNGKSVSYQVNQIGMKGEVNDFFD